MNFKDYVKDKFYQILLFTFFYFLFFLLMNAFQLVFLFQFMFTFLYIFLFGIPFFVEYFRKKVFYLTLEENIKGLEKAYFILETIEKPNFLDGKIFCNLLYDINKSMCEEMKQLNLKTNDFKEYIEMWIHEVKTPISSLELIFHNKKNENMSEEKEALKKLEDLTEQILYYIRCENASQDYFIKKVFISKVVSEVALKNKDSLLAYHIDFLVDCKNCFVYTDSKWLSFILNQIIHNSIKYRKLNERSYIKIYVEEDSDRIYLNILDNGIGINPSDQKRVFEKTFTGENGRIRASSTGMGLFIAKSLCEKLGHSIMIFSTHHEFTKVTITFFKNHYYEVVN